MRPVLQVGLGCHLFLSIVIVRAFRRLSWLKLPQDERLEREHEVNIGLDEASSAEPTKSAGPSAYSVATVMLQVCRVYVSELYGEREGDVQGEQEER
jgi:hypothetical protein